MQTQTKKQNQVKWYSIDLMKPQDGQKVAFKPVLGDFDIDDITYEGVYLLSEDMFFIGNEETGDFLFSFQVSFWKNI
jgi:hypothetical protein